MAKNRIITNPNLSVVITNNGKPSLMVNVDGHEIKLNSNGSSPKPKNLIIEYKADSKPESKWIDENCVDNIFDGYKGQLILKEGLTEIVNNDVQGQSNIFGDVKEGNVKEVDIPLGISKIGNEAFLCCSGLTSVTIPDTVTEIGDWTFSECSSLSLVMSYAIVPPILGDFAFNGIDEYATLTVPTGSVEAYQKSDWAGYFKNITDEQK